MYGGIDHSAGDAEGTKADRKRKHVASMWRRDPKLEEVARLQRENPAAFERLSAEAKMSLGYYLEQKAAAEAEGVDVSGDAA